jgi:three-Cys-motif partner protein
MPSNDTISQPIKHSFGGPWTENAECYTRALTAARFDLWYVDAFAGSGERQVNTQRGGIFSGEPLHMVTETLAGSAKRALAIDPPFHHFVFNEPDPERNRVLQQLKAAHPNRDIQIFDGDANEVLRTLFDSGRWRRQSGAMARGMVFLDPYALQVDWATLELLARTGAVDVWYLFPLRDVVRQLARHRSGIGPKEARLDRVLSPRWRDLYSLPRVPADRPPDRDLFGDLIEPKQERNATQRQIEDWFKRRLESIFPYASEPLPLLTGDSRQAFSLFLCVANRSRKAIDLAKHFHGYVMKNFAPGASRQKSGRGEFGQ